MKRAHGDVIGTDNDDCKIIEKLSVPTKRPCLVPIETNQSTIPNQSVSTNIKEFHATWTLKETSALLTACLTHKSGKLESFNDWYQVWVKIIWPELPRTIDACRHKIADIVKHISNWDLLSKVHDDIVQMIKNYSAEFKRILGCKIATKRSSSSNSLPTNAIATTTAILQQKAPFIQKVVDQTPSSLNSLPVNAVPIASVILQRKMAFVQKVASQTPAFPFGVFKLPNFEIYKTKMPIILWQEACEKDEHFMSDYITQLDRVMRFSPQTRVEMVADQVYGHIDDWFGEMMLCESYEDVVKTIEHYSLVWVWLNLLRVLLHVKFGAVFETFFSPFK